MSYTVKSKITAHGIMMDTRSEAGHWVFVVECPVTQQVELIRRWDAYSNSYCVCGAHI